MACQAKTQALLVEATAVCVCVCVCVSGVALIPFIAELMEHEKCKLYPMPQINNIQTHWKCIIHSTGHRAAVDGCLKCRDPLKP